MLYSRFILAAAIMIAAFAGPAYAQDGRENGHDHRKMMENMPGGGFMPKIDEKTGGKLPTDLVFTDSAGERVTLGEALDGPALLVPVYYTCTDVCAAILAQTVNVATGLIYEPGVEFTLVAVSFDPGDTPEVARQKKDLYLKMAAEKRPIREDGWLFLTGDPESIGPFMDSVGFRTKKVDQGFLHPTAAVAVSSDGTIKEYLRGPHYNSRETQLALMEASGGGAMEKLKLLVYQYDQRSASYRFHVMRIVVTGVALAVVVFLAYKIFTPSRKR